MASLPLKAHRIATSTNKKLWWCQHPVNQQPEFSWHNRHMHVWHKSRKIAHSFKVGGKNWRAWTCLLTRSMLPAVFCCYSLQASVLLFAHASQKKQKVLLVLFHEEKHLMLCTENILICRIFSTNRSTRSPRTAFGETSSQQLLQYWKTSSEPSSTSQCQNQFQCETVDQHGMRPLVMLLCLFVSVFGREATVCIARESEWIKFTQISFLLAEGAPNFESASNQTGDMIVTQAQKSLHHERLLMTQKPALTVIIFVESAATHRVTK